MKNKNFVRSTLSDEMWIERNDHVPLDRFHGRHIPLVKTIICVDIPSTLH